MIKNKLVKLLISIMIVLGTVTLSNIDILAASFSVSSSASSVKPGASFTVRVSISGAGKFSFSASNGTVSKSSDWVEGSSSFTVTAGQSGATTVSVTAVDAASSDGVTPITGTKSVTVKINKPSTNTGGGSTGGGSNTSGGGSPSVDTRSKDNNLESLTISEGTLSPKFEAGTTSYKVDLTSDISKVTVKANAKDSKAKVSGIGEKELKVGENNLVVTVVAENGAKKTYTISVYVTEKPTVFTKVADKDYGILSDFSKADLPKGYTPTPIKIDGKDVTSLKNEKTGLTLLYLQDTEGKTGFYIYENNSVTGLLQTITINQKSYVLFEDKNAVENISGLTESTIKIGDLELQGWKYDDEKMANYSLVYLMNEAGEKSLYSYESTEGTLQKYISTKPTSSNSLVYVLGGTTALFTITTGIAVAMYFNFKKKSVSAIKDYYESKNQGE